MLRTRVAKPGISKTLIGHLLGNSIELREWILLGLQHTPLTGFPELDDGERLLLEGMFSRSRRIYTFGAGPQQPLESWDQSKAAYENSVRNAKTASELLRDFYHAAPRHIHLRTRHIPSELQEAYVQLSGKKCSDLESRVDLDQNALKEKLSQYPLPETLFTLADSLGFAYKKPLGEDRLTDLRGIVRVLRQLDPAIGPFLTVPLERLMSFDTLRMDLLKPAVRYVSSERYSMEVPQGTCPKDLEIKPWLSQVTARGRNKGYDRAIARELRSYYPRVFTETSASR